MKTFYVELRRKRLETFGMEVQADSEEAAQDQVIMAAPGNPRDWEIIITQPGVQGPKRHCACIGGNACGQDIC